LLPVRGKLELLGGTDVDQDVVEQLLIEWYAWDCLSLCILRSNESCAVAPASATICDSPSFSSTNGTVDRRSILAIPLPEC
jgi:hypothetical protein